MQCCPHNDSANQCKQASAAALDNCFRRSSTSTAFCWRSWSDSLMLESVPVWTLWTWSEITREKRTSKQKPSISCISAHIIAYLFLSILHHITIPRLSRCNVSRTTKNKKCKQASAVALDNCFRRSSTSSAFRCRSWSDSLMLESVYVWKCSGMIRDTPRLRQQIVDMCHIYFHLIALLSMQCVPHNGTLQGHASASKVQQLPWTTVFEDLQLQPRSAFAPGLIP